MGEFNADGRRERALNRADCEAGTLFRFYAVMRNYRAYESDAAVAMLGAGAEGLVT